MWTLAITKATFISLYIDTPVMRDIKLYERNPISEADLIKNFLPSKLWRLNNIYRVIDKKGKSVIFVMNWSQHKLYASMLVYPKILILKSRQQGISTFVLVHYFDCICLRRNIRAGVQAQGLKESNTLKDKVVHMYNNLHPTYKKVANINNVVKNYGSFTLENESSIEIGTTFRSGTLHRLLISEYGKISAEDPKKASEIKSGTLQAIADDMPTVIESTAEGMDFKEMWKNAEEVPSDPAAFKRLFLPWVHDADCRKELAYIPDPACEAYFSLLKQGYEKHYGCRLILRDGQKAWWKSKFTGIIINRDKKLMGREYPGFPNEAFESAESGSYYSELYHLHIKGKHEVKSLYDSSLPVYVGSDLGYNDLSAFIFFQLARGQIRIIDEYHNSGKSILHYGEVMHSKPYEIDTLFLPHDALHHSHQTAKTPLDLFQELGFQCTVVAKTRSVVADITLVRSVLPHLYLDESLEFIKDTLVYYSKEWNSGTGTWKDKPKHDVWSNPADALRNGILGLHWRIRGQGDTTGRQMRSTKKFLSNVIDGLAL